MVRILGCLLCLIASVYTNSGFSQVAARPAIVAKDSIFTLMSDTLVVNVTSVSSAKIFFTYPDSANKEKTLERKVIQRIVYASGKVEQYNKPVFMSVLTTDWRSIIVTDNPADVDGMHLRAIIIGLSSSSSKSAASAKTNAEVKAKKKAANCGGMYVLVKERKELGGYGEIPKYYLEGEVYGTTPLSSKEQMKNEVEKTKKKE